MKRNYSIGVMMLVLCLLAFACSDLFEDSIEDETVVIVTPSDGTVSKNYTQTFWWEELDGALEYRLQVVYNKFDSSGEFRMDTLLTKNKFTLTLKPSRYQWRVIGMNGSSETKVNTVQNLQIDSTTIAGQDLLLSAPANGVISSDPSVNFEWQSLPGATKYRVQLFAGNTTVIDNTVSDVSEFAYVLESDGTYYWKVTGEHNGVFSNPSEQRSYILDREAPDSVKLVSPAIGAGVSMPVTLSWNASDDDRFLRYEVYLYKGNTSTPFSGKYNPYSTTKTSLSFTEGVLNDKILWKVRVVDKAGNKRSDEKIRRFTIQ